MGNRAAAYSGGSGAGYKAIIRLDNPIVANVVVGTAGVGYSRDINRTPPDSSPGGATTLKVADNILISAGGGGGARSWQSGGSVGSAGVISVSGLNEIDISFKTNGNNGNGRSGSESLSVSGASSVYSGHTYGSSGNASGSPGGGRAYPSKHGYILIKYLGQNNPLES